MFMSLSTRLLVSMLALACFSTLSIAASTPRDERVRQFRERAAIQKARARAIARRQGWALAGPGYEVMAIENGRVYARGVNNIDAAISIAVDQVRYTPPYSLSGAGVTVGLWDQGLPLATHIEMFPRVTHMESGVVTTHTTFVAGTLVAAGSNAFAMGMAPAARLECYEWNNDLAEVTARAMTYPGESNTLQISNHSYDYLTGWTYTGELPTWYGVLGFREDSGFGIYDNTARDLDVIAWSAPYYLQIKAAGNDRGEPATSSGFPYSYWNGSTWAFGFYNPATGPRGDADNDGGYDTIPHEQNAKNILVVGAVVDAVGNGVRSLGDAAMTSFSSWGPTDDGRVKPDVVANGYQLLSCSPAGDTSYAFDSGTSMATPTVSGGAALLTEYYARLFPGAFMRASLLKGLIIHTADDLGRAGPDYQFGWGLVDIKAAADQIATHASDRARADMREGLFTNAADVVSLAYVRDGTNAIRATLCWTDLPGVANTTNTVLDEPTPRLVHDLDMVVIGPDGVTNRPYVLNLLIPTNVATTGDNDLDNVEQVDVPEPSMATGVYRIVIGMEGALATNRQDFSLLVSGLKRADEIAVAGIASNGFQQSWHSFSGGVYQVMYSTDAGNPTWTPLGGPVTATSESISFTDTNAPAAQRFYRFE